MTEGLWSTGDLDPSCVPAAGSLPAWSDPGPERLKVLISAYACEPGRGSEPGIGWNTAVEAAKYHEVWVITPPRKRALIEAELARRSIPNLHFVYYGFPRWLGALLGTQFRYYLWQLGVRFAARRLHARVGFDVAHHVSFVRVWSPSGLAFLSIPFVWGPVGGGETVEAAFRKELGWRVRAYERVRDLVTWMATFDPLVRRTARNSTIALANYAETVPRAKGLGARAVVVFPECGLDEAALAKPPSPLSPGPVRFASMSRLLYWKGIHLGLRAFARLDDPDGVYVVVGRGPEERRLKALAESLGVADRVTFLGDVSRKEWISTLGRCDALVHPCLCNSGSMVSLEAMAAGRPVICLDKGGITHQVTDEVGFKLAADDPEQAVRAIAAAMESVARDREAARRRGFRAWERVRRHWSWEARGRVLDRLYRQAFHVHRHERTTR